jgi:hypothetical protein
MLLAKIIHPATKGIDKPACGTERIYTRVSVLASDGTILTLGIGDLSWLR